jgi:Gas vesicle synthesis protein GvpO
VSENGDRREEHGDLVSAVRGALEQFAGLTRLDPVAATGVRREQDGWSVLVDVVELERIPATTSVMATYRVDLDRGGQMSGYERLRRFSRGSVDQS